MWTFRQLFDTCVSKRNNFWFHYIFQISVWQQLPWHVLWQYTHFQPLFHNKFRFTLHLKQMVLKGKRFGCASLSNVMIQCDPSGIVAGIYLDFANIAIPVSPFKASDTAAMFIFYLTILNVWTFSTFNHKLGKLRPQATWNRAIISYF